MNKKIKEILENIKCPQLGYDEYGKWEALPLNVRMTLKRLCDYVVTCDDYITNLRDEIDRLKNNNQAMQEEMVKTWEKYDNLQKENEELNNIIEELKEDTHHLLNVINRNEKDIKIYQDEWLAVSSLEYKLQKLKENKYENESSI